MTKSEETTAKLIGYVIWFFILAAILSWQNGVISHHQFTYCQWLFVSFGIVLLSRNKTIDYVYRSSFAFCLLAQLAHWAGMLPKPLFAF